MVEQNGDLPSETLRRCAARSRAGHMCAAPPLRDSRYCTFHDQRPEVVALMAAARGKGQRRERVLAHLDEPLPVDFETEGQLRSFERGVLKRLLARSLDPATARASVELARSILAAGA